MKNNFRFKSLLFVFGILLVLAFGIFIERNGIIAKIDHSSYYLSDSKVKTKEEALADIATTNLVLFDSQNETSALFIDNFKQLFLDMKIQTDYVDISEEKVPDYNQFQTVVVLTPDLEALGEKALQLMEWVEDGGNVLFAMSLQKDPISTSIEHKLGIIFSNYQYALVDKLKIDEDFMLGAKRSYVIDEPFESSRAIELNKRAQVHMQTDDDNQNPLIWSYKLGQGKVVVDNIGLYEKVMRGFYAASYSLLQDVSIYPVINSSAFTLDDFPAPVPSGTGYYIQRDYDMSISDFYTNIWWPNMLKLADDYGIKYTGVVIENYEDDTTGKIVKQTDLSRFTYFGNTLLQSGGEIGYHGYNHQPLSLSNVDYGDAFAYNTWDSRAAAKASIQELVRFTDELFPSVPKSVYVPPSNILSAEGRALLVKEFPMIKVIAASYFTKTFEYDQEFEVAKDGIIEEPRISSGTLIDDYIKLTMVSELNMHYVNHHFIHPDDPLDPDRGAKMGWKKMFDNLYDQMKWLYQSAPSLRNMTESEMGGAIQRYSSVNVTTKVSKDEITFRVGNLVDEAYFMVRINEGEVGQVSGGSLEQLTDDLYLLRATDDTVVVKRP